MGLVPSRLVIGKAVKPRCFEGVKSLPCQYKSPKKFWMDSEVFSDNARKLDAKFHVDGRKVGLIIDNCPAHPNVDNLKAIELHSFFYKNYFTRTRASYLTKS